MQVIVVKSNHPSINPQTIGEGVKREDGSYEVTFKNIKHEIPGHTKAAQDVTVWFPADFVKEL